ncbi:MAG: hypothetical protein ACHQQ3_04435 [Gemmatimonadales bacterium]
MNSEIAGGHMAACYHAAIRRINAVIDAVVSRGLALVAQRLNGVVDAVDRVDGGTGRGFAVASAMARLTGFELREQGVAIVSPIPGRLAEHAVLNRARRTTSPARTHSVPTSSHAMN